MFLASLLLAAAVTTPTERVLAQYEEHQAPKLVPMLSALIAFPTDQSNAEAHAKQKAWLMKTAAELGFVARDAGKITEIELPAAAAAVTNDPDGAPVLGLVIHGDVVPVDPDPWSFPPFEGRVENGFVLGRGAVDDKGPLVQALLSMKALADSGIARTHTIRLLVGSEEESGATEIPEYLKTHAAPDYSLVLDSEFPVVVGEKAWDGLALSTPRDPSPPRTGEKVPKADEGDYTVALIAAGLSPSIVPDRAEVTLLWKSETPDWTKLARELRAKTMPEGTRLVVAEDGARLRVVAYGKSTHAGMNLANGRNALVALAGVLEGKLPRGGADDLLAFARLAGKDLYGTGLNIKDNDPIWGRYGVNVATIKPAKDDTNRTILFINLRRTPPRTSAQIQKHLAAFVADFNKRTGASLTIDKAESYFEDEPLVFDPKAKFIRRLMDIYTRATGERAKPAISGGGTYAKRIPNAIAFGMWFPGTPYPGHDIDEKISIVDLHRGARVLIHALVDIATGEKIDQPFKP